MDKRGFTERIRKSIAKKDSKRSAMARIAECYPLIEEFLRDGYTHKQILDTLNRVCRWRIKLSTFDTSLFRLRKQFADGSRNLKQPVNRARSLIFPAVHSTTAQSTRMVLDESSLDNFIKGNNR